MIKPCVNKQVATLSAIVGVFSGMRLSDCGRRVHCMPAFMRLYVSLMNIAHYLPYVTCPTARIESHMILVGFSLLRGCCYFLSSVLIHRRLCCREKADELQKKYQSSRFAFLTEFANSFLCQYIISLLSTL